MIQVVTPTAAAMPSNREWYWYVLGLVTEELVYRATGGVVTTPSETAKEHAVVIGHALMVRAAESDAQSRVAVAPVIKAARAKYRGEPGLRRTLDTAKHRPIAVPGPGLIMAAGQAPVPTADPRAAVAYWELGHPVGDMVRAALPTVPPDLSTKERAYTFIGGIINNGTVHERGTRLAAAVKTLSAL